MISMRWRVKGPGPEVVEQIPINDEYAVRRFRIRLGPDTADKPIAIESSDVVIIEGKVDLSDLEVDTPDEDGSEERNDSQ